jgi:proteic killer suppression protein
MITSFRHDGLKRFFLTESKAAIQPKHAKRLKLQLSNLDAAKGAMDMNLPGWDWHALKGDFASRWVGFSQRQLAFDLWVRGYRCGIGRLS